MLKVMQYGDWKLIQLAAIAVEVAAAVAVAADASLKLLVTILILQIELIAQLQLIIGLWRFWKLVIIYSNGWPKYNVQSEH